MITEILGLAGSGMLGSVFGIFSDWLQSKNDNKKRELELKLNHEARLNGQTFEHLKENMDKPGFAGAFGLLVFTYCFCTILCFVFPDFKILTLNPDEGKRDYALFWGLISWTRNSSNIYTLSSAGLGYSLLHPVSFMIGSVITGVNASKR